MSNGAPNDSSALHSKLAIGLKSLLNRLSSLKIIALELPVRSMFGRRQPAELMRIQNRTLRDLSEVKQTKKPHRRSNTVHVR